MKAQPLRRDYTKTAALAAVVSSLFIANAFAQGSPAGNTSDAILGFESASLWAVKSSTPLTTISASARRTQGSHAFALANPSNPTTLTSLPVASTATALANVGDQGALIELDVMPPAGVTGSLALTASSPSRGLKDANLGKVDLATLHTGIYNTARFPIPDAAGKALGAADFADLTFELTLASSGAATGAQFLFDNLRVVSNSAILLSLKNNKLPSNLGDSVTLSVAGGESAKQSFDIGSVQVPQKFHLLQGVATASTVKLSLGLDGTPSLTCTYDADQTDTTGQSYTPASCTAGIKPGDLVPANFAQLAIEGDKSLQLDAQLARNPIGDQVGREILPPLPTFWGHFDTCVPTPGSGATHSVSKSCAAQVSEASKVVTEYFNKVNASKVVASGDVITAPVPHHAKRHLTTLAPAQAPTAEAGDIPFDKEQHVNPGGDWDAYWRLNGDLNAKTNANGTATGHFDATLSTHVVLLGDDVNFMSTTLTVDASNQSPTSSTASIHTFLFGQELPGGGSIPTSTSINSNHTKSGSINVATVQYWIFVLNLDAIGSAGLKVTGPVGITGLSVTFDPNVSMGVHVYGGVDLGATTADGSDISVASGGVDSTVNLLNVSLPVTGDVKFNPNLAPNSCSLGVVFDLKADVTISSVGGDIDLVATLGPCPFCVGASVPLLKWDPIFTTTINLFTVAPTTLTSVPLPVGLCTQPLVVTIGTLPANPVVGGTYTISGTATTSNGDAVNCSGVTWSVSPAEAAIPNGCSVSIHFFNPGAHTITMKASDNITDQFGRVIAEQGSASKTITIGL